jgi:hypothetical protein
MGGLDVRVRQLLERGSPAAAELDAPLPGRRAFVVVIPQPRGGFAVTRYAMDEDVIAELDDRWDRNEDYVDKRSTVVATIRDVEETLRAWGVDPAVLLPGWKVDTP